MEAKTISDVVTIVTATSTGIIAWLAFILSVRSFIRERPHIRFVLSATQGEFGSEYEETRTYCVLVAQITNTGRSTVTLNQLVCEYENKESGRTQFVDVTKITLQQGQAERTSLVFEKWPSAIRSIAIRDSTGKEWKARRRDLAILRPSAIEHWGWKS
jgi:hypothetical protein